MMHRPLLAALLSSAMLALPAQAQNLLFQDNFDNRQDWTSGDAPGAPEVQFQSDGIPSGWYVVRQTPAWAPSTGHPDRHEGIEIKSIGGGGKSAVFWRESRNNGYVNDKILTYKTPSAQREIYVEFDIRFSPDWYTGSRGVNASKIFRIYAWDENGEAAPVPFRFFPGGDAGPIFVWNYVRNSQYGYRNFVALRGGPYGDNYYMSTPSGFPRALTRGDASLNWTGDVVGQAEGGATPRIPDRVNGGTLGENPFQAVSHEQLYGPPAEGRWTKIAFRVVMNSAPGRADGILSQWVNGQRVLHNTNVNWVGSGQMVGWNIVAFGGNDNVATFPDGDRYEEWYAIDNIRIFDGLNGASVSSGGSGANSGDDTDAGSGNGSSGGSDNDSSGGTDSDSAGGTDGTAGSDSNGSMSGGVCRAV